MTLNDLTARYPLEPSQAADLLERWAEEGGLVRLDSEEDGPRWADRRNLEDVRRLSVALRRRESVAVLPEVFADFVAHRQHVHPETRLEGAAALGLILEQLRGFAAPAEFWESEILPRRVRDYRPSWLDEALSAGGWIWGAWEDRVGFFPRDQAWVWPNIPADPPPEPPSSEELKLLARLGQQGASFVEDLARATGLAPSRVRDRLDTLARRGAVTNDRFEPLRPTARARIEALQQAAAMPRLSASGRPRLGAFRRPASAHPEGRWSLLDGTAATADPEASLLAWAAALLDRYGVLTRETAALDPWAPPWRELFPVLNAAEMRGEVRRGFFVEGLSGVQFALDDTAAELAARAGRRTSEDSPVLIPSLDPANLYGSGAPFDIALLEGGTARLTRSPAHFLVLIAGRPVLIIEGHGKRLTGLASASEEELRAALALLPSLVGPARRVLKVETYNTAAVLASPAAPWLAAAGFVRDLNGMAFYAGW